MHLALLADIHANLPAFEAILSEARQRGCEVVYHLGDLISIGPYPAECVGLAQASAVRCVVGNHEDWVIKGLPPEPPSGIGDGEFMHEHWTHSRLERCNREFIRSFPYRIDEEIEEVRVAFMHFALEAGNISFRSGGPRLSDMDLLKRFSPNGEDIICFGHLHERPLDISFGGCRFLNPGAAGCSHDSRAHFVVMDISRGNVEVTRCAVEYDRTEMLRRYDHLEIPDRNLIRKVFFGIGDDLSGRPPSPPMRSRGAILTETKGSEHESDD